MGYDILGYIYIYYRKTKYDIILIGDRYLYTNTVDFYYNSN